MSVTHHSPPPLEGGVGGGGGRGAYSRWPEWFAPLPAAPSFKGRGSMVLVRHVIHAYCSVMSLSSGWAGVSAYRTGADAAPAGPAGACRSRPAGDRTDRGPAATASA